MAIDPAYGNYDPNGVGVDNGNFLGLPLVEEPRVVFLAVPFGVTVSYGVGTEAGPDNVLAASRQLDVCIPGLERPWEIGFAWQSVPVPSAEEQRRGRVLVEGVIEELEAGRAANVADIARVNRLSETMLSAVEADVTRALSAGQLPVLVGGEHAVSLGAFRACAKTGDFGILQIDAHMDLRRAYEGFTYSHASVMYNALAELDPLVSLAQVGIRDYCPSEEAVAASSGGRVRTWFDSELQRRMLRRESWHAIVDGIVATLPPRVWISFDIDGLDPALCAHTGTPVPGGLTFAQAHYLTSAVIRSGRDVVGLDLVEVAGAPYEFEGSVAARLLYDMASRAVLAEGT